MNDVINFLNQNKIQYVLHKHPAFFTCEDSKKHNFPKKGAHCKNLFIKERKSRRFFLYIIPSHKKASLDEFEKLVGCKVKFANPQNLKDILGVEPGSVSFFGLLNDKKKIVEVLIDKEIYEAEYVNFHPNINTQTLEIPKEFFHKLLSTLSNSWQVI